jgi:signal peptidase I
MKKENWNVKSDIYDFFKDLVFIIVIVMIIRTFFAMPFQINGQSMYETYYDREFIIVDRFSYLIWKPERWDVIVFRPYVDDWKEYFLKRIVWIPWDSLKIEDWKVYLKEEEQSEYIELEEPYLSETNNWFTYVWSSKAKHEFVIWEWDYFVMWDNRNHSTDSRTCFSNCSKVTNYITKDSMIWKVLVDFGYFNFKTFSFIHPELWVDTKPKFFNSTSTYDYE